MSVLVLLVMAAGSTSHAPLRLQFDKCPDIDETTVSRVVTMELEASLADEQHGGALTTATAECSDNSVHLTIDDPVTGKRSTRTVDLEGQPHGLRSRLLGLAISEAVLASWIELRLAPEPRWAPSLTLAALETRREAANIAERRLQVAARATPSAPPEIAVSPTARRFSSGLLMLGLSGSVRYWLDKHPTAGIGLDIDAGHGEQSTPHVARTSATSASVAPSLLMRGTFTSVAVTLSAGWRVGLARLSAEPACSLCSGRIAVRAWTGPFLAADASVSLWRSSFVRAGVETGYALVPAEGRVWSVSVISLDGSWLSAVLSLGTTL